MTRTSTAGQPIGMPVADWRPRERPALTALDGHWCRIERLDPDAHADGLHDSLVERGRASDWTYLAREMPVSRDDLESWLASCAASADPQFHVIRSLETGSVCGLAAYMRIDPGNGVIEIGHITFAPELQRTRAATESLSLLMRHAFDDLGYRRLEWKCDTLNGPSRRAAERLGFTFEGVFRQAIVTKGRNRDTAWYAIIDQDWPRVKAALEAWLAPANFDADARQRATLAALRARLDPSLGPASP